MNNTRLLYPRWYGYVGLVGVVLSILLFTIAGTTAQQPAVTHAITSIKPVSPAKYFFGGGVELFEFTFTGPDDYQVINSMQITQSETNTYNFQNSRGSTFLGTASDYYIFYSTGIHGNPIYYNSRCFDPVSGNVLIDLSIYGKDWEFVSNRRYRTLLTYPLKVYCPLFIRNTRPIAGNADDFSVYYQFPDASVPMNIPTSFATPKIDIHRVHLRAVDTIPFAGHLPMQQQVYYNLVFTFTTNLKDSIRIDGRSLSLGLTSKHKPYHNIYCIKTPQSAAGFDDEAIYNRLKNPTQEEIIGRLWINKYQTGVNLNRADNLHIKLKDHTNDWITCSLFVDLIDGGYAHDTPRYDNYHHNAHLILFYNTHQSIQRVNLPNNLSNVATIQPVSPQALTDQGTLPIRFQLTLLNSTQSSITPYSKLVVKFYHIDVRNIHIYPDHHTVDPSSIPEGYTIITRRDSDMPITNPQITINTTTNSIEFTNFPLDFADYQAFDILFHIRRTVMVDSSDNLIHHAVATIAIDDIPVRTVHDDVYHRIDYTSGLWLYPDPSQNLQQWVSHSMISSSSGRTKVEFTFQILSHQLGKVPHQALVRLEPPTREEVLVDASSVTCDMSYPDHSGWYNIEYLMKQVGHSYYFKLQKHETNETPVSYHFRCQYNILSMYTVASPVQVIEVYELALDNTYYDDSGGGDDTYHLANDGHNTLSVFINDDDSVITYTSSATISLPIPLPTTNIPGDTRTHTDLIPPINNPQTAICGQIRVYSGGDRFYRKYPTHDEANIVIGEFMQSFNALSDSVQILTENDVFYSQVSSMFPMDNQDFELAWSILSLFTTSKEEMTKSYTTFDTGTMYNVCYRPTEVTSDLEHFRNMAFPSIVNHMNAHGSFNNVYEDVSASYTTQVSAGYTNLLCGKTQASIKCHQGAVCQSSASCQSYGHDAWCKLNAQGAGGVCVGTPEGHPRYDPSVHGRSQLRLVHVSSVESPARAVLTPDMIDDNSDDGTPPGPIDPPDPNGGDDGSDDGTTPNPIDPPDPNGGEEGITVDCNDDRYKDHEDCTTEGNSGNDGEGDCNSADDDCTEPEGNSNGDARNIVNIASSNAGSLSLLGIMVMSSGGIAAVMTVFMCGLY